MRDRLAIGLRVLVAGTGPQEMPQPEQEPPVAAARPQGADGEVFAAAVALLEAAALTAAMRRVAAWNPLVCLDAAADRLWVAAGGEDQGWRTDPSRQAAGFRLAVLLAEATIGRCLAEDGYLSARQLSMDLRQAAAWLKAGAQFDGSQQATTAGSRGQPWRPWRRSNRCSQLDRDQQRSCDDLPYGAGPYGRRPHRWATCLCR
jgi:hypothetical protein